MQRTWFHALFASLFVLMRFFTFFPCLHKTEGTLPKQQSTVSNSQILAFLEIVQNKTRIEYARGDNLLKDRID